MSIYIKRLLNKKRISQKELSERLGVNPSLLSRYRSGKLLWPFEIVEKLAAFLEVDYMDLSEEIYRQTDKNNDYEIIRLKEEIQNLRDNLNRVIGENRLLREIAGIDKKESTGDKIPS